MLLAELLPKGPAFRRFIGESAVHVINISQNAWRKIGRKIKHDATLGFRLTRPQGANLRYVRNLESD